LVTVDRAFWTACALGGALIVAGCFLPTMEVGQSASIGAGDAQRSFSYSETVRFADYRQPTARLFLIGGTALVALAVIALLRTSRLQPLLIVVATALSLVFFVAALRVDGQLPGFWDDVVGTVGCDPESCAPVAAPAMRDLNAEIRTTPEAQEAGFYLDEGGFRTRERDGWLLIRWSSFALAALGLYRLFLFALRPVWAGVAVAACGLVTFVYLFLRGLSSLS
jgi:hypothetical protein